MFLFFFETTALGNMQTKKQFKDWSQEFPSHTNAKWSVTENGCNDSLQRKEIYECEGGKGKEGIRKIL